MAALGPTVSGGEYEVEIYTIHISSNHMSGKDLGRVLFLAIFHLYSVSVLLACSLPRACGNCRGNGRASASLFLAMASHDRIRWLASGTVRADWGQMVQCLVLPAALLPLGYHRKVLFSLALTIVDRHGGVSETGKRDKLNELTSPWPGPDAAHMERLKKPGKLNAMKFAYFLGLSQMKVCFWSFVCLSYELVMWQYNVISFLKQ